MGLRPRAALRATRGAPLLTRCKNVGVASCLHCLHSFFSKITQPHPLKSHRSPQLTDLWLISIGNHMISSAIWNK